MLVGGVVVEDDVDHLAGRHLGLDRVQEAHELLMAVALHVAADDGPVEDVERSKQGRGAMALVVVRHGAEPALLQRQARLGPAHDLVGANTVGAREDDRRPPSVFLRGVTVPGDRFKSAADGPRDRDGNSGAHAPHSHGNRNRGIPIRTLLSANDH